MKPIHPFFETNNLFSGGAGMFIQYHDIIKPVWFYAISKMILNNYAYGLPIQMLKHLSIAGLLEWYLNRRYVNPLEQLDYNHQATQEQLNQLMASYLNGDSSLYSMAPTLSTMKMFDVYKIQHMNFPVFIYTQEEEPNARMDIDNIFLDIPHTYVFGDLKDAIKHTKENFTYIFSDIEIAQKAAEILIGTCSNILVPRDYRYNYKDYMKTFKYDLGEMARLHPYERIETIIAMDFNVMKGAFNNLKHEEDRLNASSK